ncbi:hypothetical protein [Balneola vulgaris]|jgi:uncharacterized membrane protein YtjA (UPF0391 family)|uniref:hypothetical protein n=1 Tax=Balneola vulgaris TaxID=287535 RepID=UPI00035CE3A1|nr:hypothetical protein [Balneola vulgaris]
MYNGLLHAHSGLRWVVLVLLVLAIIKAFSGWFGKKEYTAGDKKIALFALIATHIQLLLGLGLYFISPKVSFAEGAIQNEIYRFYTVEHMSMMIIAIIIITLGFSLAKRTTEGTAKFRKTALFYTLGLLIILSSIPWPFTVDGAGWF